MLVGLSTSQEPAGPCNHAGHLQAAGPVRGGSAQGGNDRNRVRKPLPERAAQVMGNALLVSPDLRKYTWADQRAGSHCVSAGS